MYKRAIQQHVGLTDAGTYVQPRSPDVSRGNESWNMNSLRNSSVSIGSNY